MNPEDMIGRSYTYKGYRHEVLDATHPEEDLYVIKTDKRTLRLTEEEVQKDLKPIKEGNRVKDALALRNNVISDGRSLNSLSDILLENIKKVQADPKFIDQARATNETAKTIIDLKRAQLEAIRLAREIV